MVQCELDVLRSLCGADSWHSKEPFGFLTGQVCHRHGLMHFIVKIMSEITGRGSPRQRRNTWFKYSRSGWNYFDHILKCFKIRLSVKCASSRPRNCYGKVRVVTMKFTIAESWSHESQGFQRLGRLFFNIPVPPVVQQDAAAPLYWFDQPEWTAPLSASASPFAPSLRQEVVRLLEDVRVAVDSVADVDRAVTFRDVTSGEGGVLHTHTHTHSFQAIYIKNPLFLWFIFSPSPT